MSLAKRLSEFTGRWFALIVLCRAVSIEVGMQNSGLAATLATVHFNPTAALPGAVFSVWHNISGSLLAGYWGRKGDQKNVASTASE